uniref:Uncharacterized protein n=1 Tax=Meloidogyne enterolobii TaxID=390850 RepID=A0A6V7XCZ2_MELEN|nr:unnamed protein product [Meloidogyne enterolobii]
MSGKIPCQSISFSKNALKYFLQLNIHKYMHVCINISTTFGKIGVLVLHRRQHHVLDNKSVSSIFSAAGEF